MFPPLCGQIGAFKGVEEPMATLEQFAKLQYRGSTSSIKVLIVSKLLILPPFQLCLPYEEHFQVPPEHPSINEKHIFHSLCSLLSLITRIAQTLFIEHSMLLRCSHVRNAANLAVQAQLSWPKHSFDCHPLVKFRAFDDKLVLACLHARCNSHWQPCEQMWLLLVKHYHSESQPSDSTFLRQRQEGVCFECIFVCVGS